MDNLDVFRDFAAQIPDELSLSRDIIERRIDNPAAPPQTPDQQMTDLLQAFNRLQTAHLQLVEFVLKGR
ncbi:hypothetical protein [Mycolicibacterium peregrinum]|uniref:Uncharacterized protein n=1 Tax=Mycolicibacterium peregrinum TaxID=43304 RepID=A0A4Z0HHS1_MYCPR|nr:hypothetical protein [Mycolicibacterium peregrinum]TGB37921.1 hypothetical protein EJD98_25580 [Mycolicibacterium peregrinum]TGB38059.1 hypothetical protein EJD94_24985 [Mycolicibacterium peregrinum]